MILAGGRGSRLHDLTKKVAKPAVSYGGKYRIIDFPLSNCANSGIDVVGVLTQYESVLLNSYAAAGRRWGLDTKDSGVYILPPREKADANLDVYRGTADAISQNIDFIDTYAPEYLLVLSGDHIYKMDYDEMLAYHKEHHADATIAVIEVPMKEASRFGIMNTEEGGKIVEFEEKPAEPKSNLASMGIYIFNWKLLRKMLLADMKDPDSNHDFGKDIIPRMLEDQKTLYAYKFKGYWKDVGTIDSLWEANMDLLDKNNALDLADSSWKIYTQDTDAQSLIKQVDFTFTDGVKGSAFIIFHSNSMVPQLKKILLDTVFVIILILILTALGLCTWTYRGVMTPLTQLKEATKNIKEGNLDFTIEKTGVDEIGDLCDDFEEMRKRLKESAEEKVAFDKENKELISNISHDLKTPITAVKGYVEGIMDGVADTPEKMDRYIRTIYNKANEMDRLINELTFYSKIDTNRIPYTFNKIHISDYFEDCVDELSVELESSGVSLTYFNYLEEDAVVIADAEQLKRVINNIVSNSLKYMDKPKGVINIRLRDVGDFIQIEIEDNGKGIAQKDLANIFERFYRTDASRNSSKGGSGIGLSIVKKIMEDHGGQVWATSKEGTGTTMYLALRKYQEVPVHE